MNNITIKKSAIVMLAVSSIFLTGCGSAPVKELVDLSPKHYAKIFAQQQSYVYDNSKSKAWNHMQERGVNLGKFDMSNERYQKAFDVQEDEFNRAMGNAFSAGNIAKNVGLFVIGTQFSTDLWSSKSAGEWAGTKASHDSKKVFMANKDMFKTKLEFSTYVTRQLFTNNQGNMTIDAHAKWMYPRVIQSNNKWVYVLNAKIKDAKLLDKLISDYKRFPKVGFSFYLLPHESTPFVKAPHVLTSAGERLLFIKPEAK